MCKISGPLGKWKRFAGSKHLRSIATYSLGDRYIKANVVFQSSGFSPLFALHRLLFITNSSQPLSRNPHFNRKAGVTSQFSGSHEGPHTNKVAPVFLVSQNAIRSWHKSSSSISSWSAIRLSRILWKGKKSSQGWWGMRRWNSVGRRLGGIADTEKVSTGVLKIEIASSSCIHSIVMPIKRVFSVTARCIFSLERERRWSMSGELRMKLSRARDSNWRIIEYTCGGAIVQVNPVSSRSIWIGVELDGTTTASLLWGCPLSSVFLFWCRIPNHVSGYDIMRLEEGESVRYVLWLRRFCNFLRSVRSITPVQSSCGFRIAACCDIWISSIRLLSGAIFDDMENGCAGRSWRRPALLKMQGAYAKPRYDWLI